MGVYKARPPSTRERDADAFDQSFRKTKIGERSSKGSVRLSGAGVEKKLPCTMTEQERVVHTRSESVPREQFSALGGGKSSAPM